MDRLTEHDLRNVRFLMSLGSIGLMRFMQQASEDDIRYANEIMRMYKREMEEAGSRFTEDSFLSHNHNEIEDFSDAKLVLKKFMLNK